MCEPFEPDFICTTNSVGSARNCTSFGELDLFLYILTQWKRYLFWFCAVISSIDCKDNSQSLINSSWFDPDRVKKKANFTLDIHFVV